VGGRPLRRPRRRREDDIKNDLRKTGILRMILGRRVLRMGVGGTGSGSCLVCSSGVEPTGSDTRRLVN
jgi:hypothetical protein